jgi:tetratricopeptide (TPR) repeat protein
VPGLEANPDLGFDDDFDFLGGRVVPFRMKYADYLLAEKNYAEAAQYYHKTWLLNTNHPLPLFMEGHAKRLAGDAKEGQRLMDLARWMPLGSEILRSKFSDELVKRGFTAESQREMQFILDTGWFRSYQVGNIHARLARRLARKNEFATASAYYDKDVVSLFRTGAFFAEERSMLTVPELARIYRIRALLAAKKDKEALAETQLGLQALPGNVDLAIGIVPDLERDGKKKEADEIYLSVKHAHEAALKDFPNAPELRNGLAWTMVNCRRDLDDAQKHSEKAVALMPKTASYIDTLAEIHFRKKNRTKAMELMKQCAAIEPTNPYFRKQLERFAHAAFDSPLPDEETGED